MEIQGIHPRNIQDLQVEMLRLGASASDAEPLAGRNMFHIIRVYGADSATLRRIKRLMERAGGTAAMPLSDYSGSAASGAGILLSGSTEAFSRFVTSCGRENQDLARIARTVRTVIGRVEGSIEPQPLMWPDGPMVPGRKTYVMGIINCTPDSFYDGGVNYSLEKAVESAAVMIGHGADIIDVGGESTRPGSDPVSAEDELKRTVPFIKELRKQFPDARISIDTVKASVAAAAVEAGAGMINDISGLRMDPDIKKIAAAAGCPVCIMHMQGSPSNMQKYPSYPGDVCYEINSFFRERIAEAVDAGITESQIVLDTGIGFGKSVEHNLEILSRHAEFRTHGLPLLIGASRKSFIGMTLDLDPEERLEGSLAAAVLGVVGGVDIVRAHDVKETVRAVRLADAVTRKSRMLERANDKD